MRFKMELLGLEVQLINYKDNTYQAIKDTFMDFMPRMFMERTSRE